MATGSIIEDFEEDQENNQRFRIYRQIMQNFFGVKTFAHYIDVTYSAYLMANRGNRLSEFIPYMQDNLKELAIIYTCFPSSLSAVKAHK